VYGLVASMGGKVEISSEVGKGTEVSIVLPVRR
jgi:signal transduction histidine kinase